VKTRPYTVLLLRPRTETDWDVDPDLDTYLALVYVPEEHKDFTAVEKAIAMARAEVAKSDRPAVYRSGYKVLLAHAGHPSEPVYFGWQAGVQ